MIQAVHWRWPEDSSSGSLMGSWLSALVSCTLHHSQGQSKTQGGRSTVRTQGPTREQRSVSMPHAWHEISQARAPRRQHTRRAVHGDVPPVIPAHPNLLVAHSMSGFLSKTSYEHWVVEPPWPASIPCLSPPSQGRATVPSEPRATAARPFHAGRRTGECVCAHLSHPLGGAEPCRRAQTDFPHATGPRSPSSRRRNDR
jgi:hypothetical protein